ncbi:MAG TPA: M90 family metallopeptidase [Gemmatimonadales bacterium]|nr:M90 family metallopeptidase [Gemmatimonadales bacterium]
MGLLVMLAGAAVFVGAFMLLKPVLLRLTAREVAREAGRPIPARWRTVLSWAVPQGHRLPLGDQERWLRRIRELIVTTRWEGCSGLVLTEAMQLTVAGQASLLTLGLGEASYRGLREILLYPRTFVPTRVCDPLARPSADNLERPLPELGEAWSNGIVVLSWDSARDGAANPRDGRNVVYHEFAHQIDYDHGLTAGARTDRSFQEAVDRGFVPDVDAWERAVTESFAQLCDKTNAGTPSVLDPYGATNLSEFFAVATEAFFERPSALAAEYPALFGQLKAMYRVDPTTWTDAISGPGA